MKFAKPRAATFLLASIILACATSTSALELEKGDAKRIFQFDTVQMRENQQMAYASFKKRTDFNAAFAVSLSSPAWGAQASSNLEHSKTIALARCNQYTENNDCRVLAVAVPNSVETLSGNVRALTPSQKAYIQKQYFKTSILEGKKYSVLAGNSLYVVARTKRTHYDRAVSDAMSDCERYSSRLKGTLHRDVYDAMQQSGALECYVLHAVGG
ncbi:hypothetical protein HTT03_09480 [Sulfitobacter sp. S0837]|uniref:hypothetical protein n=1 Tax=Sulfitobacter maritimus TaxID=2741719 RepID=UPI00158270F6|nr:hypothetical protein [Sulfitobacter maritimus]NUH65516.1 hypothetical protein [Sulfitobacter maritimus]